MSWTAGFAPELVEKIEKADRKIAGRLEEIRQIALSNQAKVLAAFTHQQISETHFMPSTGYGHDDMGRDALEAVYAEVFATEAALVRPQIVSGTHAIATALFGSLRPEEKLVYITGTPYDTWLEVIGLAGRNQRKVDARSQGSRHSTLPRLRQPSFLYHCPNQRNV